MTYLATIKLIAALAIAGLLFFGGRSCGVQSAQDQLTSQARLMDAKDRALRAASRSFAAFAGTFRAIDAHTIAQLAEGRRRAQLDLQAGGHAVAAEAAATLRARKLEDQLAAVRAARPACRAIFEADLHTTCGVTLR